MSIAEITSAVQALSRPEKLQLVRLLLDELANEDLSSLFTGRVFPIHTPQYVPGAAAQLDQMLKENEAKR